MKWEMDLKNWNFHGEPPHGNRHQEGHLFAQSIVSTPILCHYIKFLLLSGPPVGAGFFTISQTAAASGERCLESFAPLSACPVCPAFSRMHGSSLMSLGVTPHPSAISCAIRKCEQNKCLSHRSHRSITSPVKSTWGSWGTSSGPVCQLWVCVVFCLVDVFNSARVVCVRARQVVYHWATLSGQFKSSLTQR